VEATFAISDHDQENTVELDLADRVVVVTGGSDGLGAAAARTLLREGARVAVCGRSPERLEVRQRELAELGDVHCAVADVRDPGATARFLDAVIARWGRVDGLVNNAGTSSQGAFLGVDDARWAEDFDLKVLASARALRHLHAPLAERGGAVVNVLSITAKAPGAGTMPTSVSRAAGLALGKALSREWGPEGIRVNSILVGMVRSGQWERIAANAGVTVDELLASRARDAGIPLGRPGREEDFANLAAFLLSPRSGYITGAAITLDGGLSTSL
jgi:NAD(P)-dependent dehydrogenase (short-subunit alcohol dehydrogenase family)